VRVDAGVEAGSEVTVHYDPLLAKIVALGRDRHECVERLQAALEETVVLGVDTNLPRLQRVLAHPVFLRGDLDTGFLQRYESELRVDGGPPPEAVAAAVAALAIASTAPSAVGSNAPAPATDPWTTLGPWRLGA
jgi:acetyl-CoA/propionyl-CoA carboxylase biotin carboxyl carrier protein